MVEPIPEPAPQPIQRPTSIAAPGDILGIIRSAAVAHGMNPDFMVRIAKCESTFNPFAVNTSYTAWYNGINYGHPKGLFQHVEGYWPARANKYGWPGASVFDATANANVTAAMMAAEGTGAWECK